jgi:16S rRNA (guanine966-N2)-methyltransferase
VGGRLKTSLFSVLAPELEGARVLDLCAGVGGFGLEALSRGASEVLLLDTDTRAVQALRDWIEAAGVSAEARAERRDVLRGTLPAGPFDVVFLDPPYALWEGEQVGRLIERGLACTAAQGLLVLKIPERMDLPEDPRWRLVRRTAVASAAYALLARA